MENNEIRVAVVEDDPLLAEVVSEHLGSAAGFGPVSVFHSAASAVREIPRHPMAHVALVDLRLNGMSGLECIRRLREIGVATKLIAFTSSDNPETIVEVLRAGADGYLLKNRPVSELVHNIIRMCSGKPVLSEEILPTILNSFRSVPARKLSRLTPAEQNVLALTAEGLDCKAIGRRLGISVNTVYVHNKRILRKVGVGNRNAAAALLRRESGGAPVDLDSAK